MDSAFSFVYNQIVNPLSVKINDRILKVFLGPGSNIWTTAKSRQFDVINQSFPSRNYRLSEGFWDFRFLQIQIEKGFSYTNLR